MIQRYPSHAVNYDIPVVHDKDGGADEAPLFIVVVPRAKGNGYYDSTDVTPDVASGIGVMPTGDSALPPPQEPELPGQARLRHLGPN